jgi:hypothetical protein
MRESNKVTEYRLIVGSLLTKVMCMRTLDFLQHRVQILFLQPFKWNLARFSHKVYFLHKRWNHYECKALIYCKANTEQIVYCS